MTYAASSAGLWVNRANTAWGASRQYNVGSSFESDSATWHSRADQAWGASRVWSSGTSFETDRNAAYQSGTWGSGQTWHYYADQAWGASRVWNSGESWEAAYNRVLPLNLSMFSSSLASVNINYNTEVNIPISGITSDPLGWGAGLVCPKTGQYFFFARCWYPGSANVNGAKINLNIYKNGGLLFGGWDCSANTNYAAGMYAAFQAAFNQGDTLQIHGYQGMSGTSPNAGGNNSQVNIVFIPTQANPH